MTQPTLYKPALIPDLPRSSIVDKDGMLTHDWVLYFQQLTMVLQTVLSPEGIIPPKQTATNIASLVSTSPNLFGSILYDSTNDLAKINIAGSIKTILTS